MRILVTGGAGFIGSHVVDAYVAAGHEVVVVDNLSAGRRANVNPAATFYRLELHSSHLDVVFRFHAFDVVSHHAAQVNVRRMVEDPMKDVAINVGGTIRLLELCRRHRVRGVIFASSGGAIYGDEAPVPTGEDAVARPVSPYGISKLASEGYLDYYGRLHGLPAVILRYADVYGPRQGLHGEAGIVATLCNDLLEGEVSVVCGDGEQTRDFIYVDDVTTANLQALKLLERHGVNGDGPCTVNIGTGQETTVNALIARLAALTERPAAPLYLPPRVAERRRNALNPSRARAALGWAPVTPLRDGLLLTLEWFERSPAAGEMRSIARSTRDRLMVADDIGSSANHQAAARARNNRMVSLSMPKTRTFEPSTSRIPSKSASNGEIPEPLHALALDT